MSIIVVRVSARASAAPQTPPPPGLRPQASGAASPLSCRYCQPSSNTLSATQSAKTIHSLKLKAAIHTLKAGPDVLPVPVPVVSLCSPGPPTPAPTPTHLHVRTEAARRAIDEYECGESERAHNEGEGEGEGEGDDGRPGRANALKLQLDAPSRSSSESGTVETETESSSSSCECVASRTRRPTSQAAQVVLKLEGEQREEPEKREGRERLQDARQKGLGVRGRQRRTGASGDGTVFSPSLRTRRPRNRSVVWQEVRGR